MVLRVCTTHLCAPVTPKVSVDSICRCVLVTASGQGSGTAMGLLVMGNEVSLLEASGLILMSKVSNEMTKKRNCCHYASVAILYQLFPVPFPLPRAEANMALISFTSPFNFIGKKSWQCITEPGCDTKGDPPPT